MYLTDDLVSNLVAVADSSATLNAVCHYKDINHRTGQVTRGSKFTVVSNTSIAVCAAADAGVTRCIEFLSISEASAHAGANELVTVSLAPATLTARARLIKVNLTAECSLQYTPKAGWQTFAAGGLLLRQVAADA